MSNRTLEKSSRPGIVMNDLLDRMTSLSRPLDPQIPSNRLIILFSAAVLVVSGAVHLLGGADVITAGIGAIFTAGTTFAAWALARELDPDHNLSAGIAALLGLLGFVMWGDLELVYVGMLVVALRFINRTVGPPPTLYDNLLLFVIALWLVMTGVWMGGIAAAAAFALSGALTDPDRYGLRFAALALVMTALITLIKQPSQPAAPDGGLLLGLLITGGLFIAAGRDCAARLTSACDRDGSPLDANRLFAGQLFALGAAVALALWLGDDGFSGLVALWAAFVGIIVTAALRLARR